MNMRKILALLMAVVMICSMFVSPALAAGDEGIVAISETVAPQFSDLKDHWSESAIIRWAEAGIVKGDGDGTVHPERNLKRAELATVLARILGLKATSPAGTFSDVAADAWYADAVLKCHAAGIMLGVGGNRANPESPIDRQQAIVMVGRALGVKESSSSSLDRFADKADVADWAAPYMAALADMNILSGVPQGDTVVVAPNVDISRAATFVLLDKAIAQYVTAPCTVTVNDPNKFVVINASAEEEGAVTVTGKTAGVVVAAGTTNPVTLDKLDVDTVKVDAPAAVTVSRDSSVDDLDVNAAAKIDNKGTVANLNTNADDVIFDGNKPSKVNTAEGVEPAKDSKGNEVTDKPANTGSSNTTPSVVRADLVAAPLFDQAAENAIPSDNLGTVKVTSRRTALTDGVPTYEVTLTGKDIMNHNNAQQRPGHWVGFGMPAPAEGTYTYLVGDTAETAEEVSSIAERTYTVGDKTYNTVYFSNATEDYAPSTIVVKDGEKTKAIYNVKFNVTFKADYAVTMAAELPEELLAAYDEVLPIRHKTAAGLGLNAVVSGNTMTLDGTTTLAKLEATVTGASGDDGYVLYAFNVGNTDIKKIKTGAVTYTLADFEDLGMDGMSNGYLLNTKIYDGTDKTLLDNTVEIELLDANDRVQGKISQTFKATGCSIDGMKKAVFMDGDTVVATRMDATSVTAPAVPTSTDEVYYTGNWVSGETKVAAGATYTFTGDAKEIIFTAENVPVEVQATKVRVPGPEGNLETFDYEGAYTAAGLTLKDNVITVDGVALLKYAENREQFDHLRGVNGTTRNSRVVMGVEYTAPTVAGKEITQFATAPTLAGLAAAQPRQLSSYPKNQLISYTDVATYDEANGKVILLPDVKQDGSAVECEQPGVKLDGAPYTKWMDENGNVLAVTKVVLERKTNVPTYTVTFKADGETVETKTVAYNAAIGELPAAVPAKAGYTGAWMAGDTEVTTETVITAHTEVVAEYTAIEYTVTVDGTTKTMTVEDKDTMNNTQSAFIFGGIMGFLNQEKPGYVLLGCDIEVEGKETTFDPAAIAAALSVTSLPTICGDKTAVTFTTAWGVDAQVVAMADTSAWSGWAGYPTTEGVDNPFGAVTLADGDEEGVTKVTGTLNLITGFTGFNSAVEREQSGYYVAIEIKAPEGVDSLDGFTADNAVIRVENKFSANPVKVYKLTGVNDTLMLLIHVADAPEADAAAVVGAEEVSIFVNWKGLTAEENGVPARSFGCTLDLSGLTLKPAEAGNANA